MAVRQIRNEEITSLTDLDRQLVSRQAGVRTVEVGNVADGLQQGETIEINQKPDYQGKNVDKNAG
jgi:hypothetical protein